ncbi:MAG: hypothetical protein ACOCZ5_01865 [bacterium]
MIKLFNGRLNLFYENTWKTCCLELFNINLEIWKLTDTQINFNISLLGFSFMIEVVI